MSVKSVQFAVATHIMAVLGIERSLAKITLAELIRQIRAKGR
jgi:hypothetical protein